MARPQCPAHYYGRRFRFPPGSGAPWRGHRQSAGGGSQHQGAGSRAVHQARPMVLVISSARSDVRLIADELVLQLATFLRSLDLFLELTVLTPGTLTANQTRHGGKQGTDNPKLSPIHSSACPDLTSL